MNPALLAALITLTAEAIKMFPEAMRAYGEIVAAWSKSDQTAEEFEALAQRVLKLKRPDPLGK